MPAYLIQPLMGKTRNPRERESNESMNKSENQGVTLMQYDSDAIQKYIAPSTMNCHVSAPSNLLYKLFQWQNSRIQIQQFQTYESEMMTSPFCDSLQYLLNRMSLKATLSQSIQASLSQSVQASMSVIPFNHFQRPNAGWWQSSSPPPSAEPRASRRERKCAPG